MRKLIVTLTATAAILMSGLPLTQAEAQLLRGAGGIPAAAQNYTPVEKTTCRGTFGPWCGPGYTRACGPYRCWCRPCW